MRLKMKRIKDILDERITQTSDFKLNADEVYMEYLKELSEVLSKRGDSLVVNETNKRVLGQIVLWYTLDKRFKGDLRKGLMIRGNVGTGKTVIVKALKKLIKSKEGKNACFLHSIELQDLYIQNDLDGIDRAKKRDYTIIDDVGTEAAETKLYGNAKEPFNDVFDYRYRNDKITIITTNLPPSEIENTYGTRIIDRFRECMNDLVLDGKSFRK